MIYFLAAAFLLATALVAALAVPLILKREPATAPAASGLADQLAAIESSRAAGLIRPAEAAEAEIEIKRAMLGRRIARLRRRACRGRGASPHSHLLA